MQVRRIKKMFFAIRGASAHQLVETPPSYRKELGEKSWCRDIDLIVSLPRYRQRVSHYKEFVDQVLNDIPELSVANGGITCGERGDFAVKARKGRENLGHFWEHVCACAYDRASVGFDFGADPFIWRTSKPEMLRNHTIYHIQAFHGGENPPPAEFFGIEEITCGYLNAVMLKPCGHNFDFHQRIRQFIEHRTEEIIEVDLEPGSAKNPKGGLISKIAASAAYFLSTQH